MIPAPGPELFRRYIEQVRASSWALYGSDLVDKDTMRLSYVPQSE